MEHDFNSAGPFRSFVVARAFLVKALEILSVNTLEIDCRTKLSKPWVLAHSSNQCRMLVRRATRIYFLPEHCLIQRNKK
jgi:hypothetical protein